MTVIVIGGMPGSGKTTLAMALAHHHRIEQVIQTDTIKELFQLQQYPEIAYTFTHQAWKFIGEKTTENIITGFNAHASYFEPVLQGLAAITGEKGKQIIIEGAQATPAFFSGLPVRQKIGFFLTVNSKERGQRFYQKNTRRTIPNQRWQENMETILLLDSYLQQEAARNGMIIISNNNLEDSLTFMRQQIKNIHRFHVPLEVPL